MTARTVELDVREYHRRGEEPFEAIMGAVDALGPEDALVLINSFEPLPLYRVMAGKGFDHEAERLAEDHWRITFRRRGG